MQTLSITFCNCALLVRRNSVGNRNRVNLSFISSSSSSSSSAPVLICRSKSKSQTDSLRVLEWDKLCDVVASFARTSLGRVATKVSNFFSILSFYTPSSSALHSHWVYRKSFGLLTRVSMKA